MPSLLLYLHAHRGYVLRRSSYRELSMEQGVIDTRESRRVIQELATQLYIPKNARLREMLRASPEGLRVALCVSGVLLEQLAAWAPEGIESFQELYATGGVELVGSTVCQSFASQYELYEFGRQVREHASCLERLFGVRPTVFYHAGEPYDDCVADEVASAGYSGIIGSIPQESLGWRSPHTVYRAAGEVLKILPCSHAATVLLTHMALNVPRSDGGTEPTQRGLRKVLAELRDSAEVVGLPFSYEGNRLFGGTFGQLCAIVDEIQGDPEWSCITPSECVERSRSGDPFVVPRCTQDTSGRVCHAPRDNRMQGAALRELYALSAEFQKASLAGIPIPERLIAAWRTLQGVDYVQAMSTSADDDGHFSRNGTGTAWQVIAGAESPYEVFISYMNMLRTMRSELTTPLSARSTQSEISMASSRALRSVSERPAG